ncbi:translation machinery-associated protein 22 [Kwoniella dejecticola CBS 10117]|uniref:Translation machinery-associated protein 22 n=1 Tax=Kwoniella dejecticola CBS 10117 TaxID=1296121 RepID=A0A1A5ZY78_9TREE|nr:translation machinery-associated protein 22 [Kwoniella dejecticola CBS 10117]OBR82766.1 translation machinery-associated protein 22 [Kwoniella dejecticola CBS 10117]
MAAIATAGPSTKPITPHYCAICSLPTEYCEFGPSFSKCKTWLEGEDQDEYERLWGEGNLAARIGTLSVEKQEKIEADAAKAEKKAAKKAEAEAKKKGETKIIIKRSERTKRKHQTHIQNLELFGIDLKKAAKLFAGKFATGSSVSKIPGGGEEIVIQGDVGDDIVEMLKAQVGVLKGAPADQVTRVEVKKKKAEEEEPAA